LAGGQSYKQPAGIALLPFKHQPDATVAAGRAMPHGTPAKALKSYAGLQGTHVSCLHAPCFAKPFETVTDNIFSNAAMHDITNVLSPILIDQQCSRSIYLQPFLCSALSAGGSPSAPVLRGIADACGIDAIIKHCMARFRTVELFLLLLTAGSDDSKKDSA
jgi:hypothetical protein